MIAYQRGDIVDRNGTRLATSERVYNVILDVVVMTDRMNTLSLQKKYSKSVLE